MPRGRVECGRGAEQAEQQAQAALLACLRRRAASLTELYILPRHSHGSPAGLEPLWPMVLQDLLGSYLLRTLCFDAIINTPDFPSICQVSRHAFQSAFYMCSAQPAAAGSR